MAQRLATKDELFRIVPQLKDLEPAEACLLDEWMEIAGSMINVRVWKTKASKAHALLTAHLLATSPDSSVSAGGGPLAGVTVGPVSKTYAVTACDDCELGGSKYGLMYRLLRRTIKRTPLAIGRNLDQF